MFRLTHPFLRLLALGALGLASLEEAGAASPTTILFLGDSLTAGYGLDPDAAYPALVEARLQDAGHEVEVLNGGLSGETTAGGLRRVRWVMRRPIDILVIALGGNDLLRGLPPEQTEANLEAIIE
ncbi:MAG: GDSL-type esterase/lipase family protein, partial [Opitutales bacterium]